MRIRIKDKDKDKDMVQDKDKDEDGHQDRNKAYCLKAKGQVDIKLQAARLIWPGGMSGAPESGAPF